MKETFRQLYLENSLRLVQHEIKLPSYLVVCVQSMLYSLIFFFDLENVDLVLLFFTLFARVMLLVMPFQVH